MRILQIFVDSIRSRVTVRKTPYMYIDSRESENFSVALRWYASHPTGDTRARSPLHIIEEEDTTEKHVTTEERAALVTEPDTECSDTISISTGGS